MNRDIITLKLDRNDYFQVITFLEEAERLWRFAEGLKLLFESRDSVANYETFDSSKYLIKQLTNAQSKE